MTQCGIALRSFLWVQIEIRSKACFFGIIAIFHTSIAYSYCLDALRAEILSDKHTQNIYVRALLSFRAEEEDGFSALRSTPRARSLRFDLSDPYELSEKFFDDNQTQTAELRYQLRTLSQYELMLLSLRAGDGVIFDSKSFVLGEFLGRGNTTHVWALANDPDKVIRLPFSVGALRKAGVEGVYKRNEFMLSTLDALRGSRNSPEIFDYDQESYSSGQIIRYMIVQRVNGSETGAAYIRSLTQKQIDPESERSFFLKSSLDKLFRSAESVKFDLLVQAMRRDGVFYPDNSVYVPEDPLSFDWVDLNTYEWPSSLLAPSRQYLWDLVRERWFLVDGN